MRRTIVLVTVVGMLSPLAAHALNEKVWLAVNGGGGTYDMSQVNAEFEAWNAANPGFVYPLVKNGYSWGFGAGVDANNNWNYGAGLDRLHANTKASDASGSLEYQFTANAWHAYVDRAFGERRLFSVGGGAGLIAAAGNLVESQPGVGTYKYKLTGTSPMFEGHAGGCFWVNSRLGMVVTAGYRYAKVKQLKIDGSPAIDSNGAPLGVDYSGPYARMGFKLIGNIDR